MPATVIDPALGQAAPAHTEAVPPPSRLSRFRVLLAQGLTIVVSVLLALAADRMMLGLDERALERSYLRGLSEDFQEIESTAEYARVSAASRDSAAALVLLTLRGNPPGASSGIELARALELSGWVIDIRFARATWDDMVGTGRLGILRNAELRREIAAFYRQADQLYAFTRDWVQMAREYSNVTRTIIDPELRVAIGSEFIYREPISPQLEPAPAAVIRRMTSEPALLTTIGDMLLINKVSARTHADLAALARKIRTMLNAQLEES